MNRFGDYLRWTRPLTSEFLFSGHMSSETPVDAAPEKMSAARQPWALLRQNRHLYVTHPAKVFWSGILALFAPPCSQDMASFSAQSTTGVP